MNEFKEVHTQSSNAALESTNETTHEKLSTYPLRTNLLFK